MTHNQNFLEQAAIAAMREIIAKTKLNVLSKDEEANLGGCTAYAAFQYAIAMEKERQKHERKPGDTSGIASFCRSFDASNALNASNTANTQQVAHANQGYVNRLHQQHQTQPDIWCNSGTQNNPDAS